jgi:hypothetical protein
MHAIAYFFQADFSINALILSSMSPLILSGTAATDQTDDVKRCILVPVTTLSNEKPKRTSRLGRDLLNQIVDGHLVDAFRADHL